MKDIEFAVPQTLDEAVALLKQNGERARILAGGTDIIVQMKEGRRDVGMLIDVKRIPELMDLQFDASTGLTIGAAVPCHRIYENEAICQAYPALIDSVGLVGGIQIQNRASIGGNMCTSSPAADTTPNIIAHSGTCKIAGPDGIRDIPAEEFCTGPGKTILKPQELLVSIHLPPTPLHFGASYLRFIPRNEMDIAVVGVGVSVTLDESKAKAKAARIALGAVGPTPMLVSEAGAAMVNGAITEHHIEQAASLAQAAATPINDMRGDIEHRKQVTKVLVQRALTIALDRARGTA